jgi:hypothetical protein
VTAVGLPGEHLGLRIDRAWHVVVAQRRHPARRREASRGRPGAATSSAASSRPLLNCSRNSATTRWGPGSSPSVPGSRSAACTGSSRTRTASPGHFFSAGWTTPPAFSAGHQVARFPINRLQSSTTSSIPMPAALGERLRAGAGRPQPWQWPRGRPRPGTVPADSIRSSKPGASSGSVRRPLDRPHLSRLDLPSRAARMRSSSMTLFPCGLWPQHETSRSRVGVRNEGCAGRCGFR